MCTRQKKRAIDRQSLQRAIRVGWAKGLEEKVNATAATAAPATSGGGKSRGKGRNSGGRSARRRRCCSLTATGRIQSAAGLGACRMCRGFCPGFSIAEYLFRGITLPRTVTGVPRGDGNTGERNRRLAATTVIRKRKRKKRETTLVPSAVCDSVFALEVYAVCRVRPSLISK